MSNYPDGVSDNNIDQIMSGSDDSEKTSGFLAQTLENLRQALGSLAEAERETNNTKVLEAISDSINWVEGYAIPYCEVAISELEG